MTDSRYLVHQKNRLSAELGKGAAPPPALNKPRLSTDYASFSRRRHLCGKNAKSGPQSRPCTVKPARSAILLRSAAEWLVRPPRHAHLPSPASTGADACRILNQRRRTNSRHEKGCGDGCVGQRPGGLKSLYHKADIVCISTGYCIAAMSRVPVTVPPDRLLCECVTIQGCGEGGGTCSTCYLLTRRWVNGLEVPLQGRSRIRLGHVANGLVQINRLRRTNRWRRGRDSNPRRLAPQRFSRPPHSTALPPLRGGLAYPI